MNRITTGTFAAVIRAYQASPKYQSLGHLTRRNWNRVLALAELPETLGAISTDVIRPALVQAFLDGLAATPGKQNIARTALKAVEKFGLVRDLLPFPIMTGTEVLPLAGGFEPWSDEMVTIAEVHARPDLSRVVTLGIETGQRGSDIVKMRWSDLEDIDGRVGINVRQQKTGRQLWIPLTQRLQSVMGAWERRPPFFLVLKPDGRPYMREQLSGQWWEERGKNPLLEPHRAAELVLHGLRASAVIRARRHGAKVLQIADMFGMSEPMVARYSRFADQRENAMAAVVLLDRTGPERPVITSARKDPLSG